MPTSTKGLRKPVIGITCDWDKDKDRVFLAEPYLIKIMEAGGLPLIVPHLDKNLWPLLIKQFDGFLLSGGGDVGSFLFNEEPLPGQGEVFPPRDLMELFIVKQALAQNIPLLGICRGIQVINVASGGTIYQDIYNQRKENLQHSQGAPRNYPSHSVKILKNTLLNKIIKEQTLKVNSFHHQAVRDLSSSLAVSAVAPDGIIEAIESVNSSFALGVQWHPESMDDPSSALIFKVFVERARRNSFRIQ